MVFAVKIRVMLKAKICLILLGLGVVIPLFVPDIALAQGTFIRGDANCDGSVNSLDSTFLENFLIGGPALSCLDAADVNDDGTVTNADVIYLSNYLNSGGPPPLPPHYTYCTDPTPDTLTCDSSCGVIPRCMDGIDNDGDGLIDFPNDCGCSEPCDTTEAPNPVRQCNDGIDNDGDGLIDLADTNCLNLCDNEEYTLACAVVCSSCCYKPADVNADGKWNISDVVGLVNIVFKGAPPTCPRCLSDANGSGGNPTLIDIISLAKKIFKSGPNPIKISVCCLD